MKMESCKCKSVLSKICVLGLIVAMLCQATIGQSTHNSSISKSVKVGENNISLSSMYVVILGESVCKYDSFPYFAIGWLRKLR